MSKSTTAVHLTNLELDYLMHRMGRKTKVDWDKVRMMPRLVVINSLTAKLADVHPLHDGEPIRSTQLNNT